MPTAQDREAATHAQRQVQIALTALMLIVAALVAAGAFAAWRVETEGNHRFIDQAGPFFAVTEDLAVEMLNQETAVRGYVITADPKVLQPYFQGRKYARLELGLIKKDEGFAPTIPAHLAAMTRQVDALQSYFAREIALVKQGSAGQKKAADGIVAGKGHFDHLRAASAALIGDAGAVIKRQHTEQRGTLITWWLVLGIAGGLGIVVSIALLLRVPRQLYRLFREERMARREAQQAADASHALAHVQEAVVLLDDAGQLRYWNPSAATLFGLQAGETESRTLAAVLDEFHGANGKGTRPVMLEGGERWLVCTETEFEGGRVCLFRDVSDDQRLERLRSDFVATAAHELRTPLAAVYGAVRTLRQEEHELAPEVAAQFLEMIEREAERLKLVMDQLLVSAQLDSADLHLHHEPVDAVDLVEGVVRSAALRKPAEIELAIETPPDSLSLDADPERLRQVVANLIDNAIKYSPGGGKVSLRVFANGSSGVIEVSDQGLGIPVHEQRRIFEKFYRLDPSMTRGIGGSGLGLYISRELVQQMGGRLSVASRYGAGSTFTVTLALSAAA